MMTLALMLHMTTIVFNILYFVGCCPPHKEQSYVRASWIMNFLAGTIMTLLVLSLVKGIIAVLHVSFSLEQIMTTADKSP